MPAAGSPCTVVQVGSPGAGGTNGQELPSPAGSRGPPMGLYTGRHWVCDADTFGRAAGRAAQDRRAKDLPWDAALASR